VNPLSWHRKGAASSPFSCFATKGGAKGKEGFAPFHRVIPTKRKLNCHPDQAQALMSSRPLSLPPPFAPLGQKGEVPKPLGEAEGDKIR